MLHFRLKKKNHLPHVGTSSSADEVCSSVDGFFFPKPMIFVIFFPVTFVTVPLASDFELFFLFTVKKAKVCILVGLNNPINRGNLSKNNSSGIQKKKKIKLLIHFNLIKLKVSFQSSHHLTYQYE